MKALMVLMSLQLVLLGFIAVRLGTFDPLPADDQPASRQETTTDHVADQNVRQPLATTSAPNPTNGTLIRQIVREELRAALSQSSQLASDSDETPDTRDPVELQYRAELMAVELDVFRQLEIVSSAEIDQWLAGLADLDPQNRKQLLSEFNRALNTGEIRGKL